MNPQGTCCLGNVSKAVQEAEEKVRGYSAARMPSSGAAAVAGSASISHDATSDNRVKGRCERGAAIATVGAVFSAVTASACCWLPLLLLAVGVSGAGVASVFEQYRPIFLTGTFALLAVAWYLTYEPTVRRWFARSPATTTASASDSDHACCATPPEEDETPAGESCCATTPDRPRFTIRQFNKLMLWVATAVVLVFAFSGHWIGLVLRGGANDEPVAALTQYQLRVQGMTCEGCATTLEKAIRQVPGVKHARVNYPDGRATIGVKPGDEVPREEVLSAIENAGYQASWVEGSRSPTP